MRLAHLYRVRVHYPQGWAVGLDGGWEQHLYLADGHCEGSIAGRFRGLHFPLRRTSHGTFCADLRAVIETDDGATMMFECHGYRRAYPPGPRQIVGTVVHLSDCGRYVRLNDGVCVCTGEVRAAAGRDSPDLVMDVADLIWEPIGG
jgi:hypothetical protein